MAIQTLLGPDNVVILANSFNPSIFDKHWYIKQKLIAEDEFDQHPTIIPQFSQVSTSEFSNTVTMNQLQFFCRQNDSFDKHIPDTLVKMIEILAEVPYSAVGFNFGCQKNGTLEEVRGLSHALFKPDDSKFINDFKEEALFGTYVVNHFRGSRLTTEAKVLPITDAKSNTNYSLQFNFNFHWDIAKGKELEELVPILKEATIFHQEALRLIELI